MNNQLIEKIIESSGVECPQLAFASPIIDRKVAKALSNSFVNILNLAKENCKINNNLRLSILENVKKLCTNEPKGHLPVDEKLTELLTGLYIDKLASTAVESTDKDLDAFLMRNFKALHIDPFHETNINPEIVKSLLNLNENGIFLEVLSKDIVHLNTNQSNVINLLKTLWESDDVNDMYNDISIKMKPEIEKLLLQTCHNILVNRNIDIGNLFNNDDNLTQLIKRSAVSSECFQICCGVLNFLFVMTNFDSTLQVFIKSFVNLVKEQCPKITISVLYPIHINYIVVLLDIDIDKLPEPLRCDYISPTIKYLQNVRDISEYDFIMLLSHFPQWFDIYFQNTESK